MNIITIWEQGIWWNYLFLETDNFALIEIISIWLSSGPSVRWSASSCNSRFRKETVTYCRLKKYSRKKCQVSWEDHPWELWKKQPEDATLKYSTFNVHFLREKAIDWYSLRPWIKIKYKQCLKIFVKSKIGSSWWNVLYEFNEKFFENRSVQHTWKQKNLYGCTKHLIGARVALLGIAFS